MRALHRLDEAKEREEKLVAGMSKIYIGMSKMILDARKDAENAATAAFALDEQERIQQRKDILEATEALQLAADDLQSAKRTIEEKQSRIDYLEREAEETTGSMEATTEENLQMLELMAESRAAY